MKITPEPFGKRISTLRHALKMTQRELAVRAGRSAGWVAKVEAGQRYPDRKMLEVLARVLDTCAGDLVAGTDWSATRPRAAGGGGQACREARRPFRDGTSMFSLRRARPGRGRRALYTDYSTTALSLVRQLRRYPKLNWRAVLRLPVTTAGEAGFVLHLLNLPAAHVLSTSPLEVGLRLMVTAGSDPPVYSGDRRRWCIRACYEDVELIVMPQVSFVGLSGAVYRADFMVGAAWRGVVTWIDVEVDDLYHGQPGQPQADAERDADVPVMTIRVPEVRLLEIDLCHKLMMAICERLRAQQGGLPQAA